MLAEDVSSSFTAVEPVQPPQTPRSFSENAKDMRSSRESKTSETSKSESGPVAEDVGDSSSEAESSEEGSTGSEDISDGSGKGRKRKTTDDNGSSKRVKDAESGSSSEEDESGSGEEEEETSSEEEEEEVKEIKVEPTPVDQHKSSKVEALHKDRPRSKRDGHERRRSHSRSRMHRSKSHRHRHRSSRRGRSKSGEKKYSTSSRASPHGSHRPKRSRSRERRHRSRSHGRRRRSTSRHRHHRSSRHHRSERRRSRSRDCRPRSRDRLKVIHKSEKKPKNFKEMMKQQILLAQAGSLDGVAAVSVTLPTHGSKNLVTMAGSGEKVTPQQALLQTMAAMHAKAQEATGVALPKYYNPAAVNPMKYAEQVQKRKLLWSKNKEPEKNEEEKEVVQQSSGQWSAGTALQGDQGQSAKFRKLMGVKGDTVSAATTEVDEAQLRKQDELFSQLDREYAFARMATHTHRGIGLGFASQGLPDT